MINRKTLNRLGAGALSLMMAFSGIATLAGTVVDSGNPNAGTSGHSEFLWYANPTHVKDVYKVSMEMDVYVKPTKAEIVLVLDNSGSMGRPYDLSPGVWEGANQPNLQKLDVDDKPYFIPENAYTHRENVLGSPVTVKSGASTSYNGTSYPIKLESVDLIPGAFWGLSVPPYQIPLNFPGRISPLLVLTDWIPQGAYNGGVQGRKYDKSAGLGLVPTSFRNYQDYEVTPYRLEWVRTATAKVLDELLLEENNPLNYDQIKISIVAFGGARTDINSTYNPLYWYPGDIGYNHSTALTAVYEPESDVTGGGGLNGPLFTSVSNAITYESKWIDNENVKEEKDKFLNGYIRRSEDTFVAAGLETAMNKLDALKTDFSLTEDWAPENRHVFILADGGDNSTADMSAPGSTDVWVKNRGWAFTERVDPTRTLAAAAKLKNPKEYNAKISTVGVLETVQHDPSGVGKASYLNVSTGSATPSSNSFAERHLLLLAAPLNASAKQFQSGIGYHQNAITGRGGNSLLLWSDKDDDAMYYEDLKAALNNAYLTFSNTVAYGDGYGEFSKDTVANLAPGYGPKTTGYTYAENEKKVFEAFSEFASQFKQSASDIRVRQKLTNMFEVYQMPGEPLYDVSNGTAKVSGRDIEWNIDAVSAKGGKVTLTYYVKFDSANADPSLYYQMAESTFVTWKALGDKTAQSNFPSVIINGNTSGNGWTIDNNNTGMNAIGDSQSSTIGTTGNVLSDMGSSNAAITGTGTTTTQGSGGGIAFLGAGPTVYTASVANTSAAAKKKTKAAVISNGVETLSDSEYKAVKGQSLKIKSSKAAVYEESKKDAKALLYLNKGKTFKIAGATDSYYMIQYKKKDGKIQKGYILKSDVSLIK